MMRPLCCVLALVAVTTLPCVAAPSPPVITPDVVYGHKDGMALTFDVFRPKERANGAGVLFMVSGGWYSRYSPPDQTGGQFAPLLAAGFTVFAVRHGSSPRYVIPEIVDDVRRAVRFVRANASRFGVRPDRLGVCGGSAGGHLSLVLGTTGDDGDAKAKEELLHTGDRVAAVVAYYPPTDVRPWVQPSSTYYQHYPALRFEPAQALAYSPVLQVTPDDPPALLIHGDKDLLVPIDHSEKILARFKEKKVPCELLVIRGAAHGFKDDDGRRASDARVAWFQKYLLKK